MANPKIVYGELLSTAATIAGHLAVIPGAIPAAVAKDSVAIALELIVQATAASL